MFEQLEALSLDGPAGKGPDVMMAAYDRIGALGSTRTPSRGKTRERSGL